MLLKVNPNNKETFKLRNNRNFFLVKHFSKELINNEEIYFEESTYAMQDNDIILLLEEYNQVLCNTKVKTKNKKHQSSYKNITLNLYKILCGDKIIIAKKEDFIPL